VRESGPDNAVEVAAAGDHDVMGHCASAVRVWLKWRTIACCAASASPAAIAAAIARCSASSSRVAFGDR